MKGCHERKSFNFKKYGDVSIPFQRLSRSFDSLLNFCVLAYFCWRPSPNSICYGELYRALYFLREYFLLLQLNRKQTQIVDPEKEPPPRDVTNIEVWLQAARLLPVPQNDNRITSTYIQGIHNTIKYQVLCNFRYPCSKGRFGSGHHVKATQWLAVFVDNGVV